MRRASVLSLIILNVLGAAYAAPDASSTSDDCQTLYNGCMDTFCMASESESGGRCLCSNKFSEYDSLVAEIDKILSNAQSLTTTGVESIKTGVDAATIAPTKLAENTESEPDTGADILSLWDTPSDDEEDEESDTDDISSDMPTGDALRSHAHKLCTEQLPQCADKLDLQFTMYGATIRSDCAGYENALKQRKGDAEKALAAAEKGLRTAALDQIKDANKYDLGGCVTEFKKCMIVTGECGTDFAGCAELPKSGDTEMYTIAGTSSEILISMATYNRLETKKILCDSILKQCTNVADSVWDTFLRESASVLKYAEDAAYSNVHQNCASNIANCFQTACKDNIDPADPDGSYDLCLTRPETMLSFCENELSTCDVDTTSADAAAASPIWDFVVAQMAAMRVNSCAEDFKKCITAEDRCGADYANCIGVDTDTIMHMCVPDSLPGCKLVYGEEKVTGDDVYEEISRIVQGMFVNIDNKLSDACQKAVDDAMIRVCGSVDDCNSLAVEDNIGNAFLSYKICEYDSNNKYDFKKCRASIADITDQELGRSDNPTADNPHGDVLKIGGVIDGSMDWGAIKYDVESNTTTSPETYFETANVGNMSDDTRASIEMAINQIQNGITKAIAAVEVEPKVQWCMTGRDVDGLDKGEFANSAAPRFPKLTDVARQKIAFAALKLTREKYFQVYDELVTRMARDNIELGARMAEIRDMNRDDVHREFARQSCLNTAGSFEVADMFQQFFNKLKGEDTTEVAYKSTFHRPLHAGSLDEEEITAEFNPDTLTCKRCVTYKKCKKGRNECKKWESSKTNCDEIKF